MSSHYIKIQRNFWKYTMPAWIRNNPQPRKENKMTNDELNRLYHEHVEGKCVYEGPFIETAEPEDDRTMCPQCYHKHRDPPKHDDPPDYASDPAVILGAIVRHQFSIYFQPLSYPRYEVFNCASNLVLLEKIEKVQDETSREIAFNRAVMLAVLKMKGVDITRTGGEEK